MTPTPPRLSLKFIAHTAHIPCSSYSTTCEILAFTAPECPRWSSISRILDQVLWKYSIYVYTHLCMGDRYVCIHTGYQICKYVYLTDILEISFFLFLYLLLVLRF